MRLKREKLKLEAPTSFSRFLGYSNPKYELEWFHKLIADHCQMLLEGKIKNLMVFMPPQHGKSEIISRNFPAWALGQNPDLKIVGCSYSSDLAQQFSRSIQRTIDSKEYQAIFPATYLNGSNTRMDARGYLRNIDLFEMVGHRGFYKAVGVGGSLTGTPVDIAIIDDPVKDANEANSITYRQRVWDWYNTVLSTRLHNNSRQLFIMTRWHEDDLAGRILKAEPQEWTVLAIPAICEQEYDSGFGTFYRTVTGDMERYGKVRGVIKARPGQPRNFCPVSCLPWLSFTSFSQDTYTDSPFLFPLIRFGRYFRRDGRMWLPLSVFVSHAAADGYHTCRLINDIQEIAARPELWPEGPETGDPAGGWGKR